MSSSIKIAEGLVRGRAFAKAELGDAYASRMMDLRGQIEEVCGRLSVEPLIAATSIAEERNDPHLAIFLLAAALEMIEPSLGAQGDAP